jgi:hypothetical protein
MEKIQERDLGVDSSFSDFKPSVPSPKVTDPVNPYYVDTIAKAGEEVPLDNSGKTTVTTAVAVQPSLLEIEIETLSSGIDKEISKLDNINFKRLEEMVYKIIAVLMRRAAKTDQEYISEMNIQIKLQAIKIQSTYNNWKGVTITVISAGISMFGGAGGLAPLLPTKLVSEEIGKVLAQSSQGVGSAGTSLGGIASIFNSGAEGERQVLQIYLKRTQDKEEDKKGSKHGNKQHADDAISSLKAANQAASEAFRAMGQAA